MASSPRPRGCDRCGHLRARGQAPVGLGDQAGEHEDQAVQRLVGGGCRAAIGLQARAGLVRARPLWP
eukprot:8275322-Alexandrium_andersonii.AAC.1